MHPKINDQKMKVDFMNGDPKIWMTTDMKMTTKPRSTYSGAPKASATAPFSSQSCGPPKRGAFERSFSPQKTPPPRYLTPAPMRPPPMSMTVVPQTTSGKSFLRIFGGSSPSPISKMAAAMHVPRNFP